VTAQPLRILINYRRDDGAAYAGRIYDTLMAQAPERPVFMDIDTIGVGVDFRSAIEQALDASDVVIAIIGRQWLASVDHEGRRRLENPNDLVRMELEAALERDIRVIPVLVGGAWMPSPEDLPDPLKPLARRQALELDDARWGQDVERLLGILESFGRVPVPGAAETPAAEATPEPRDPEPPPVVPAPRPAVATSELIEYDELEVRLSEGRDDYRVTVRSAARADASGPFVLPFNPDRLKVMRMTLDPSQRRTRGRRGSQDVELARKFGEDLLAALLEDGQVRDVYRRARRDAEATRRGLRVTLHLSDAPDLAAVPWELLYDQPRFLVQSVWTPVVRYLDLPNPRDPLPMTLPLRILGMVSSPDDDDWDKLDTEAEKAKLEEKLLPLIDEGKVELHWLPRATLEAVQQAIDYGGDFHVFHYIGHGEYDEVAREGRLVLEREDRRARLVSGEDLGQLLCDRFTLRLAVLNACEVAASAEDPLAGVATSLLNYDIPAVIGMQFAITDQAAIAFAQEFYAALARGHPVDTALAVARRRLAAATELEWATPVLFMRVADGRLFDLQATPPGASIRADVPAPAREARGPVLRPHEEGHFEEFRALATRFSGASQSIRREVTAEMARVTSAFEVEDLLEFARYGNEGERVGAAIGFAGLVRAQPRLLKESEVEDTLRDLLRDSSSFVRYRAAEAVCRFAPLLIRNHFERELRVLASNDENSYVRDMAQKALDRLGPVGP
jgi:CHAT domain-containing protein/TIR domain-containing protein